MYMILMFDTGSTPYSTVHAHCFDTIRTLSDSHTSTISNLFICTMIHELIFVYIYNFFLFLVSNWFLDGHHIPALATCQLHRVSGIGHGAHTIYTLTQLEYNIIIIVMSKSR